MSTKYKALEPGAAYFITITTVGWIDVFTRPIQKYLLINALRHCQKNKGLEIYAFCIMTNHIHLLCKAVDRELMPSIMRDFKKFTAKKIVENIIEYPESRREWMLNYFRSACKHLKRKQHFKVWQNGYHAKVVYSNHFLIQKLNYIHHNPVAENIVQYPEEYIFSSARNYAGRDPVLDVVVLFIG